MGFGTYSRVLAPRKALAGNHASPSQDDASDEVRTQQEGCVTLTRSLPTWDSVPASLLIARINE